MQIYKTVKMKEIEKTFQEDIKVLITRFRKENKSFTDIGGLFDVHKSTPAHWAKRLGIDIEVKKPTWNKGKKFSLETCKKMSLSRRGKKNPFWGKHHSEETKKKIIKNHARLWLGKHLSEETRCKISKARKIYFKTNNPLRGVPLSKEHREKIRERMLNRSVEEIRKCLIRRVPSSLEKRFIDFIDELHLPYKFVGNGEFFIERKNPDFINTNGEKIAVEVYCTIHKERFRNGGVEGWKKERDEIFKKYGWKIEYFNELQINEREIKTRLGGELNGRKRI